MKGGKRKAPERWYVVMKGRQIGYTESMEEFMNSVNGFDGCEYESFDSSKEALARAQLLGLPVIGESPVQKRHKTDSSAEDESISRLYSDNNHNRINVYTDGSCLYNGGKVAYAGCGVFWEDGNGQNMSFPLEGEIQTNNRAELMAVCKSVQIFKERSDHKTKKLRIHTDSEYVINSLTVFYESWARRGWTTGNGEWVKNRDLIEMAKLLIDETGAELVKVKGHSDNHGNNMADSLATMAATAQKKKNLIK